MRFGIVSLTKYTAFSNNLSYSLHAYSENLCKNTEI